MRPFLWGLAALALGCAAPRPAPAPPAPPPAPPVSQSAPPEPIPPKANFELIAYEVVESPEADGLGMVRVYAGGRLAGQTEPGLLSQAKRWAGRLEPGNQPLRFERWILRGTGPWVKAQEDFQPRERFYRIEDRTRAVVQLKFFDAGRRYVLQTTREESAKTR